MESILFALILLLVLFLIRFFKPVVYRIYSRRHGERRVYDNRFAGIDYINRRLFKRRHHLE